MKYGVMINTLPEFSKRSFLADYFLLICHSKAVNISNNIKDVNILDKNYFLLEEIADILNVKIACIYSFVRECLDKGYLIKEKYNKGYIRENRYYINKEFCYKVD